MPPAAVSSRARDGCGSSSAGAVIVHPLYQHTVHVHPEPLTFWELVPDELLHRIAAHLRDGAALARLRRVSRRCCRIASSDDLWRDLCIDRFNCAADTPHPVPWAQVYAWNVELFRRLVHQSVEEAVRAALQRATRAPVQLPGYGFALA